MLRIIRRIGITHLRYRCSAMLNVIGLGLRLEDVREMGLQSEVVPYRGRKDARVNLRESGATVNECNCLVQAGGAWRGRWNGERVPLNVMTFDQFIDWLERKLEAAGVSKVVPDNDMLEEIYQRALYIDAVQQAIDGAAESIRRPMCPFLTIHSFVLKR